MWHCNHYVVIIDHRFCTFVYKLCFIASSNTFIPLFPLFTYWCLHCLLSPSFVHNSLWQSLIELGTPKTKEKLFQRWHVEDAFCIVMSNPTLHALAPVGTPLPQFSTFALHMRMLRADDRLLHSLSRQPPNHIFVLLPLIMYVNFLRASTFRSPINNS